MERRNVVATFAPALLTTGAAAFLTSLNQSTDPAFVYPLRLFTVFAVSLAVSILAGLFLTARSAKKASAAQAAKAEAFRLALLGFAAEGDRLHARWTAEDNDELQLECEQWGGRVVNYLDGLGDKSKSAYFLSEAGYPFSQNYSQRARPSKVANWLVRRMYKLDQLTKREA